MPADSVRDFRYPATPGGITPSVQISKGGVTDRETRAPSSRHPQLGLILIEAPYADMTVLP